MSMKIVPKTLPGILHNLNKGTGDWGWQGLVAYGSQNVVVVVDPKTVQVVQTLDRHKGYIVKVKWARENYHHDLANPYTLRLASADFNGKIIIWDVGQASVRAEFSDGSKPVADMEWLTSQDASHDLLAALHPPYNLVLWNADTGTKLWKKSYTEQLQSFAFDPFEANKLAFLGYDCILFVEDFSVSKVPSSNGKKYYISSPSTSMSHSTSGDKLSDKKSSKSAIRKVSNILVGEATKRQQDEEPMALNECLQLTYHQACRHHLILLYPREILILDLDINQTVGIVPMERTGSPFSQVIPVKQRDVLICLHENGGVTLRIRRRQAQATESPEDAAEESSSNGPHSYLDVSYDLRCQSDPLRITKNNRVFGLACCPVKENKVAILMSDSRLLVWELTTIDYQAGMAIGPKPINGSMSAISPLYTPGLQAPEDFILASTSGQQPIGLGTALPKYALCDMIGHTQSFVMENHNHQDRHGVMLKFVLTGLLSGVAAPNLVIRMCPPLTTKNWAVYQPLLAMGTSSGVIQIYNLSSAQLAKEFSVHSCTVRGIEWVSLHCFLSWAYPSPGGSGLVKNEIFLTDIQTGKSTAFRFNKEEESPVDVVKISHLKQYFVVVFKEKPFELWDLRSGTLLRQMPKNFPPVTALEWSPSHNLKSLKKKLTQQHDPNGATTSNTLMEQSTTSISTTSLEGSTRSDSKQILQNMTVREHFVFTDADGLLYHFIVEGNLIKDGSKIPPDGGMGSITCIAWKAETLVLGDVDGNLNLWDLKARVSRAIPTHRGWIKKIKFAPGRGNLKLLVLFQDGCDIWDAKEVERVSSIKCPKDVAKVTDADWAASDRPVLSCADGCVRVMDLNFQLGSSPMEPQSLLDPVFCPHILPAKVSILLKYLLQQQPWNKTYSLTLEENEENADVYKAVNEQFQLLDPDVMEYLPVCQFGTAQRCLLTARLFGDEYDLIFWTIALHYLRAEKAEPNSKKPMSQSVANSDNGDLFIPNTPAKETHDLLSFDEEGHPRVDDSKKWAFLKDKPLETCYDVLCDNQTFQKYQLDRTRIHDSKRVTYEHTKKCAENLMLLGQTDRAVQLLLETESDNDGYYVDCLRACLVASIRSSGASQSTIKLVATNLIANSKLSEGVQLLCLIEKGLDACRYLQTYGKWYEAAWLAKATLDQTECSEVLRRWSEHLASPQVNLKGRAILVLLSLGQFRKVIEILYSMRHFDQAALFIESCKEFDLLDDREETKALVEAVHLEYARLWLQLGHRKAFEYYCSKAGDKGQKLLKEINSVYDK